MHKIRMLVHQSDSSKEQAYSEKYFCVLDNPKDCDYFNKKQCLHCRIFGHCPYGRVQREKGTTKRAKSYRKWLETQKEEQRTFPNFDVLADKIITNVGEYIYLPYNQMDHQDSPAPVMRRNNLFLSGLPFIKKELFTPQLIVALSNFRPFGGLLNYGEYKDYQQKEVPKFLLHVKYKYPDLFNRAIALDSSLLTKIPKLLKPTHPTIAMIPSGETRWTFSKDYKVLDWDGEIVRAESPKLFLIDCKDVVVTFRPLPTIKVIILDDELAYSIVEKYPESAR